MYSETEGSWQGISSSKRTHREKPLFPTLENQKRESATQRTLTLQGYQQRSQIKLGNTRIGTFQKKIQKWSLRISKDSQNHYLPEKCKLKTVKYLAHTGIGNVEKSEYVKWGKNVEPLDLSYSAGGECTVVEQLWKMEFKHLCLTLFLSIYTRQFKTYPVSMDIIL